MGSVRLPSPRYLPLVAWFASGILAAMAIFAPGVSTRALLFASLLSLVAGQCLRNRYLTQRLRDDTRMLAKSVDLLECAEGLAGVGRWCIECEPRRHLWSEEMCNLVGLPPRTPPREDILRRIMPEGLEQIELLLEAHRGDHESFVIEFEVRRRGDECTMLRARAKNVFASDGRREQVFMVVRDVSEHYRLKRDRDEALERAARARKEADTDALTGLANRRRVMAKLDEAVMCAREAGKTLSVIVFDIDEFKSVNDRYGHPIGDKVIRKIAQIAARQARRSDVVGRIGGEEFLWLIPDCDNKAAQLAAERLRWAVEAGTHSAPIPSITISVGHGQMEPTDTSLMLFARADRALLEAKQAGRNCVVQAA